MTDEMFNDYIIHIKGFVFVKLQCPQKPCKQWCTAHEHEVFVHANDQQPLTIVGSVHFLFLNNWIFWYC